ncbi:MAG: polysaccharide lyase family 7 protein [Saprospiraceae bacterium]|nr:polysaccharide lyase family 7 protein [Saprospiraceae bacterium]
MKISRLFDNWIIVVCVLLLVGCDSVTETTPPSGNNGMEEEEEMEVEGVDYFLPKIDLNNWKVTLPIGSPTEVEPPEILDYANNSTLLPFMYNDSTDASLVFYTYPGASTANSSYSRTELREQMDPGSNSTNWTFTQGGRMKGTLKMEDISKESDGDYHRTIIMQIHGRLTNEQRDLIGEDDNNAPPVLKIYWNKGKVRVIRKVLKDVEVNDIDILKTDAWTDEAGWLGDNVDFEKFTLEIVASEGRLEVILNDGEANVVFEDIHMQKWGVFENYFKAGNYLQTGDNDSYATVKYYDLEVSH